jgi:muramoyltetrapeptide carboxypeptidase
MIKPPALVPGDRLAVVAPASPFDRQEFDDGIEEIRTLGLEPVFDETVFARHRDYLAGSAAVRADAIRRAWRDSSIAGLVAVRGGYGSVQVLPLLDVAEIRRTAKPFIGYSDLTALLTFLTMNCGLVAFHGPMLAGRLGRGAVGYDRDSFERSLFRTEPVGEMTARDLETLTPGDATGPIFGGTLTQLLASLGTSFAFDPPTGFVLWIDEVGERPYRLDRMVVQLQQTGILARASAVVIGELPRCDEPSGSPSGRGVMADLFADFPGPVLIGFPSGHTVGPAMTLPLGVRARVVGGDRPRLVIEEAAVV